VSGCTGLVGSLTNASILSHRDVLGGTRVVTTSLGGTTASLALPLVPWVGSGGRSRYAKSLAGLTPERNSIVAASCSCAMREGGYETGQGQVGCGGDEGSRSVRPMAVATGAMV
jgi:hypothetical protein